MGYETAGLITVNPAQTANHWLIESAIDNAVDTQNHVYMHLYTHIGALLFAAWMRTRLFLSVTQMYGNNENSRTLEGHQ